ncbi:MAG TPA: EAL domain-containing protein [Solirubrobacteraceae bacterium]|nr:EAL domain-containing protein [Solirubrobacteraceae bacterium]
MPKEQLMVAQGCAGNREVDRLRAKLATVGAELAQVRRTLEDAQRLAHLGTWEWDLRDGSVYWSAEMFRLHGYEPGEVVTDQSTALSRTHLEDVARRKRWFRELHASPEKELEGHWRLQLPDGTIRTVMSRAKLEVDDMGEPLRYVGTVQDMSAEARSREADSLLSQIVMSTNDAIYTVDTDLCVLSWNPAAERLFGYTAEEMIGQSVEVLMSETRDGTEYGGTEHAASKALSGRLVSGDVSFEECESTRLRKDGTLVEVSAATGPLRDYTGKVIGLVASVRDITERRRTEAQLAYLASHDALTGLYNRSRFEEEVTSAAARAEMDGQAAAVLMLDLDNFKYVNESYGHKTGDELVASVAAMLRRHLRKTDVLARFGGDEFGVLVAPTNEQQAAVLAEQLRTAVLDHELLVDGKPVRVSASIGVASFCDRSASAGELLADVDRAMYQSKECGRDRVTALSSSDRAHAREQLQRSSEHLIRDALEHDHFELYVQPIVNLRTGVMTHCEVLLRLNRDGTVIPPAQFLPAAERLGLIHLIDRWVIDHAFALPAEHEDLTFELNLSGATIDDEQLVAYIGERLAYHGTDPSRIVFELTETAAVGNIGKARELSRRLAELGCTFAIDDFGTGFSTFYYLKHFPAQYVKIDGEFLSDTRSRMDDLVIESIVRIGRDLGKLTIAEYVSDAARLERVRSLGVDYGQGYHFSKPFPASELADYPRQVL